MNRSLYLPLAQVTDRFGSYIMPDWLGATYLPFIQLLPVQEQYILQAKDVPFPDLLSYRKYGTIDYWWILCMYNGAIDPIWDMQAGQLWKIPTFPGIQKLLANSAASLNVTNQIGSVVTL